MRIELIEVLRKCFLLFKRIATHITQLSYIWIWICINLFNVGQIYTINQKMKIK